MDIDRNTIIGLILIGLVIAFTYSDFYKKMVYDGQVPQAGSATQQTEGPPLVQQEEGKTEPEAKSKPSETVAEEVSAEAAGEKRMTQSLIEDFQLAVKPVAEQRIEIETPLYQAVLSNRGPSVISWSLKHYLGPDSLPHQMIAEEWGNLSLSLPIQGDTLNLADFTFELLEGQSRIQLDEQTPSATVRMRLELGEGRIIEQAFVFYYDKYSLDMDVSIKGLEKIVDGFAYGINWAGGLKNSETNLNEDMNYTKAYALTANDIEEFDVGNKPFAVGGADDWIIRWGAIRTKYFTAAIIPTTQNGNGIKFVGRRIPLGDEQFLKEYSIELRMPYLRRDTQDRFTVYIGPLQYSIIKQYNVQLERMMNFGWKIIRPISKLVLWSLTMLYKVIPNYGLVIIIFSILVKLILYPLTKKSYQSMKEMQKLQPEMQRLREKYKDDPQKLNQEVMKLYREYGVNPLGGCLPMLLQMPLLYALFIVFRSTIELRGAPFFGWIHDLSVPDTVFTLPFTIPLYGSGVNILPIVMGLTMFYQQKMTIQDPKQKAMVYIMPIFFTLIFNQFPSGLTLYYTLFNVLSLIQQKYIPDDPGKPDKPAEKKKKKRRPRNRYEMLRQMRRQ
ncbi:MAG: membrane protein insertase YidC [candidate division KSB1 bacterium]|nr:membrane protein insertase YidC [candidate division KSB1 bacterium]